MKSNKQRSREIKENRHKRVKQLRRKRAKRVVGIDVYARPDRLPRNAVYADLSELAHNNTYGRLPAIYVDRIFLCMDCGATQLWRARQQKWWFEIVKGNIDSRAVRCRACRKVEQARIEDQKRHMEVMARKEPHPNEAFFKRKPQGK